VCWDPSGEFLASVSEDSVRVWTLGSGSEGECVHELSCNGNKFHSCVFHPTFSSLLVVGCYEVSIHPFLILFPSVCLDSHILEINLIHEWNSMFEMLWSRIDFEILLDLSCVFRYPLKFGLIWFSFDLVLNVIIWSDDFILISLPTLAPFTRVMIKINSIHRLDFPNLISEWFQIIFFL